MKYKYINNYIYTIKFSSYHVQYLLSYKIFAINFVKITISMNIIKFLSFFGGYSFTFSILRHLIYDLNEVPTG